MSPGSPCVTGNVANSNRAQPSVIDVPLSAVSRRPDSTQRTPVTRPAS